MAVKVPVKAASTANIASLSGERTIDGVALVTGDRCLVKNQTAGANNGIYIVDTGDWTRAPDFDGAYDVTTGTLTLVVGGTVNADSMWRLTTATPITIGTTSLAFTRETSLVSGITPFILTLIDDADAPAARATLGFPAIAAKGDIIVGTAADTLAKKTVGADGTAVMADSSQSDGLIWVPQYPKSLCPNPFFQVDQLVNIATSCADDTYGHDHWYVLTQTASVQVSSQTAQENGVATNARLTQNQAASQRMGYACIIETKDSVPLRGRTVTFRPRVRISNSQALRIAVLEWTGGSDNVTSDVVLDWTNGTYTAGNFFLAASLTVSGVGAKTPAAATWTDMDALTVTLGNSISNLVLLIWTEAVAAQNVTLDISKVRLVSGSYAGDIYIPTFEETLRYAMRYYEKGFPYSTAPAQATGQQGLDFCQVVGASTAMFAQTIAFKVMKRAVNPTMTLYNPINANAQVYNGSTGTDCSASSVVKTDHGFRLTTTTPVGSAAGNLLQVNWTADGHL